MYNQTNMRPTLNANRNSRSALRRLLSLGPRIHAALGGRSRALFRREKGIALVEVLIAVAILAIAITTYISALSTSAIAIGKEERRVMAKVYAISQLHHTRAQTFQIAPVAYPTVTPPSPNYSVTSNATAIVGKDDNIQQITVTVQFNGRTLSTLEDFKVNR